MHVQLLITCCAIFAAAICVASPVQTKSSKAKGRSFVSLYPSQANQLKIQKEKEDETRWDLRMAPVALIARWYTLDASYRITENWSMGPAAIIYSASSPGGMFFPSDKGYAIGWSGNHYFTSVRTNS